MADDRTSSQNFSLALEVRKVSKISTFKILLLLTARESVGLLPEIRS
jgi:hypothetical protein